MNRGTYKGSDCKIMLSLLSSDFFSSRTKMSWINLSLI